MVNYIWLTIAFPLAGVLINGLIGKRLGRTLNGIIGVVTVLLSFGVGLAIAQQVPSLPHGTQTVPLWNWIQIGDFQINMSLLVDSLSMFMVLIVTGVGSLIHIYAIGYMDHDDSPARFFTYLNLFVASMLVLVLSDNFLGLYMGWELVGMCSYLLIGFWFHKPEAADAGKKAFIVNRVGDFGFALGVFLIWTTFGTLVYSDVFTIAANQFHMSEPVIIAITALLFVGAIGKSAQIPLHVWLPDAMEGPTPVSALIHAATMVTAGVYMVVRSNVLYTLAPETSNVIAIIGVLTAFFAATVALVQTDLKRVLAYSTISQLGYMMLAVGVGAYTSAMFHLGTHAFFKALLFLGAGSVMHATHDVIDMRRLGGLKKKMPITYWTFIAGALALAGFPLTAGFFSKDEILTNAYTAEFVLGGEGAMARVAENMHLLYAVGVITAFLTAFYTFRAVIKTFHGQPQDQHIYDHAHENKPVMTIPLFILAVFSLGAGLFGLPAALGLPNTIEDWLHPILEQSEEIIHSAHPADFNTEVLLISFSGIIAIIGIVAAWWVYSRKPQIATNAAKRFSFIYKVLVNKYYVDELYNVVFVKTGKAIAKFLSEDVDKFMLDYVLVDGLGKFTSQLGQRFSGWQSGYIRHYVTSIFVGALVICMYFFLR